MQRLEALFYEQRGKFDRALGLYKTMLEINPADHIAMRRQVCIFKARGKPDIAIQLLNEYLKVFMSDTDAWLELAELYVSRQLYQYAAFCYEELVLSFPENYHFYVQYAEALYTIGGTENYKLALKYYCYSLELCEEGNLRSLFGICMTVHALDKYKGTLKSTNMELFTSATQIISRLYNELNSNYASLVLSVIKKLEPNK